MLFFVDEANSPKEPTLNATDLTKMCFDAAIS
jgi:hypothetical protein